MADFLNKLDGALDTEMRRILRDMELLSEACSTTATEVHVGSGKPQTKPPPGVRLNLDSKRPPPRDQSLYLHFKWRYDRARNDLQRRVIICQARVALRERKRGPEAWASRWNFNEDDDVEILIQDGEGVHIAELAATTGWPPSWIKTQRERNGREPDYGKPRPKWQQLTKDERAQVAHHHHSEGLSLRQAAKIVGVAPTTLHYYWPRETNVCL